MSDLPGTTLTQSVASEALGDVFVTVGDVALDAAINSGFLDGVPILGLLSGGYKATNKLLDYLYYRKVVRFLSELHVNSHEDRIRFTQNLMKEDKLEEFGETILLVLQSIDDTKKPGIVGRIMAAHINGHINYAAAMRLIAMVSRAYVGDLGYLIQFRDNAKVVDREIEESLFSCGLLSSAGFDGGGWDADDGGVVYELNQYGHLLVKHGLT